METVLYYTQCICSVIYCITVYCIVYCTRWSVSTLLYCTVLSVLYTVQFCNVLYFTVTMEEGETER